MFVMSKPMSIKFYSADHCPWCTKAKTTLAPEINSGAIIVLDASECPESAQATGFPFFISELTGKTHAGCPSSATDLNKKLGHSEAFTLASNWAEGVL
jgi:glutaredoxin